MLGEVIDLSAPIDSAAVLDLYFGCKPRDIGEFAVLTPAARNLADFRQLCANPLRDFSGWVGRGFVGETQGRRIAALFAGIGSSIIGDATLAVGYGSCKVAVLIGSVGGFENTMSIGDVVLADEAVVGEGLSRYHQFRAPSQDTFGQIVMWLLTHFHDVNAMP